MKILKIIGIILVVLVAIVLILGIIEPKNFEVSRSVVINAPQEVVFKNISSFEQFNKWNPWNKLDSNQVVKLEGTDGTVGAKHSWKGNDKVGEGSMTLTKVEPNKGVEYALDFVKPFKAHNAAYMNMEAADGGQKVTWGMKGSMPFPMNAFGIFMNMDKQIGGDFDSGLAALKAMSEANKAPAYEVKETEWTEKNTLSFRQEVKFQDMGQFFGMHYSEMDKAIKGAGAKEGIPLGVYYKYDKEAKSADLAAAIPYEGKKVLAKGYSDLKLPASKAYLVDFWGPYSGMEGAHTALQAKMKEIGKDHPDLVIEEYVSDPMAEKDSAKWETKIYYLVK